MPSDNYSNDRTTDVYSERVEEFSELYESLKFENVHAGILDLIPEVPGFVLDVGAGSGRDIAWFARHGWESFAVEPNSSMLEAAKRNHPATNVRWLRDGLPGLHKILRLGVSFDVILVSAVWMHLPPADRSRSFRKLSSLLKPGGILVITFRHQAFDDGRACYPCSLEEFEELAREHCLSVKRRSDTDDRFGRANITWQTIVLQLPDDGTEALPLLRHIILNDNKSSTYKLALLRALVKIAESARGLVRQADDDCVEVPLGLVSLYWIRLYKPLLDASMLQAPANKDGRGLGFVKDAFRQLTMSNYELRVGAQFSDQTGTVLHTALKDARDSIVKNPAYYTTYPNSTQQIFSAVSHPVRTPSAGTFRLTDDYLWQFGSLRIPQHIWLALCRFGVWIEPSLCTEWTRLMQDYAQVAGKNLSQDQVSIALKWIDPERDTTLVRDIFDKMSNAGLTNFCVWSGKKLDLRSMDIDHCFPFSAWPCGDLWNLLPADRALNQNRKREKLVGSELLASAEDRILAWWTKAYLEHDGYRQRFLSEACAALPVDHDGNGDGLAQNIFNGLQIKRATLKRDLQIPEWHEVS